MEKLKKNIYGYDYSPIIKKEILGLEKIASAIIYDGKVDLYEVEILREWINRNSELLSEKPLSELKLLFEEINADSIVNQREREKLLYFLDAIADVPTRKGQTIDIFDTLEELSVAGKVFSFAGKLVFGSKYKAEQVIVSNGGNYTEDINEKVDYLVVGVLNNEAYTEGIYPSEIKKALELNKSGKANIKIIRERDFVQFLMK